MYQKKSHGWYKHKDFILLDLLCIFLAFIFAYYIRNHTYISITDNGVYRNAMIFVLFADLVVIILFEVYTGVLRRDYYREFIQVLEQVILIELAAGLYLFTVDDGRTFSRAVLYLTGVVYGVLSYIVRIFWKKLGDEYFTNAECQFEGTVQMDLEQVDYKALLKSAGIDENTSDEDLLNVEEFEAPDYVLAQLNAVSGEASVSTGLKFGFEKVEGSDRPVLVIKGTFNGLGPVALASKAE